MTQETKKIVERPEWARDLSKLPVEYEPDSDRMVVVPDPEETEGAGEFQYSETTRGDINQLGTVIAVGKGDTTLYGHFIPMRFAPGDRIMYSKHAGDDLLLFEDGRVRPYLGVEITGSILIKIIKQGAALLKVRK